MKKLRLLSLVLALLMTLAMFAGCGNKDAGDDKDAESGEEIADNGEAAAAEDSAASEEPQNSYGELPGGLEAEKVGSAAADSVYAGESGVHYKDENGKYGIMTFDGKKDTGAKYADCEALGNYFQVTNTDIKSIEDVASLNCYGVVDATGKEIVPMEYASISVLNDRYIRVCKVTGQTTNKDEALVYYTDAMFSFSPSDGDTLFKGQWYVYDTVAGKKLAGVSGTQSYRIYAYGNFVKYVTDAEEQITVNNKGEQLPEDAKLLSNGLYTLKKNNAGGVYNSDHKKLFDYSLVGFVPYDIEKEYILASKYDNSVTTYVLMDQTGKIVSGEFTDRPYVYGDLIHAGEKVYDFKGNAVIEGTYANIYWDEQLGNAWYLKNDKTFTLIEKDGTILYQGTEDDVLSFDYYSSFTIKKNENGKYLYYSFADKDFAIEGLSAATWLVETSGPNSTYDIVDTLSGETIISGYKGYSYAAVPGSAIYVYAQKAGGGLDIYTVK